MGDLTPEFFDTLIIINMVVGLMLIAFRFSQDMNRPLPNRKRQPNPVESSQPDPLEDTKPNQSTEQSS